MRFSGFALSLLLFTASNASATDAPAPQWIVVVAPDFRDAIKPLLDHRKAQGFQTTPVLTTDVLSAEEIRAGDGRKLRLHVNKLCRDHDGPKLRPSGRARCGPTSRKRRSEPSCRR